MTGKKKMAIEDMGGLVETIKARRENHDFIAQLEQKYVHRGKRGN